MRIIAIRGNGSVQLPEQYPVAFYAVQGLQYQRRRDRRVRRHPAQWLARGPIPDKILHYTQLAERLHAAQSRN